ncbi:MAG TPA: zinc-ribbon domain-containing protein [Terriglobales bacterium]|nr:zinc-ribbon domain-containing protein [Terriglobales bacterium]
MTIRCPECGYENRDMYRFCGMCGATLRRDAPVEESPSGPRIMPADEPPRAATSIPSKPVAPLTTPGFITEGTRPRSLDYLLEDEPPKSRVKLVVTLVLLLLAGGLTLWHWQRDGYPWADQKSPSSSAAANSATANAASTPPSTPQPNASAPKPEPPTVTAPAPQSAKPLATAENQIPLVQPTPPPLEPAASETKSDESSPKAEESSPKERPTEADQPAASVAPPVAMPKPKPKPLLKPAAPAAPALQGDDRLVADGEKYLYGNGVTENCDLAQKNLRVAAGHSNARALTLMGAMYATGHCVNRDLPTAYRWFAKALRQDPSNSRVQQDLEILWKQMTPEERQLATKSGG